MSGTVRINVNISGLLNYSKTGLDALKEVRRETRKALNVGRTKVRQLINSQFQTRTGVLKRQARRMQTKATVQQAEIFGRVSPIPNLMNIFDHGAQVPARVLAPKRAKALRFVLPSQSAPVFAMSANLGPFSLRPRPVIQPAANVMGKDALERFRSLLRRVGK